MKSFFIIAVFFTMTGSTCNKTTGAVKAGSSNCFRARLAIKGICMNYVIQVLDGDTTGLNIEKSWKDETDGKVYKNVFALGSRCSFPDIDEGEEFYFTLAVKEDAGCNVCMAYRPVPAAKNDIIVSKTPCP